MAAISCSIVVRAFNEEKHIGRLFTGINQQNLKDIEVILVDSGSSDATKEIASSDKWAFPVRVVKIEPESFSFGRSLNLGIKEAQGDSVVIASAHVYPVYPDWLEKLITPIGDSHVGLTYGKQRGNTTTRFSEHQIFARWFPDEPRTQGSNPFCNNANAAIRKSLWMEHQYDETLSGLEDLEWAHWAIEQGYKLSYVAEAEIIHVHEDTPMGIYNRYRREAMAFKKIYPQETFNFRDFTRLFFGNVVSDSYVAIRENQFLRAVGTIAWFRLMQFWGTYQGYRQSGPLTWQLRQTFYYPSGTLAKPNLQPRDIKPIRYEENS
jgi:glycosyltransferase involved in cell wall biosynthesis